MTDVATAEQLWGRAHEHVKRGDFAQAVRDLSQCFQILQSHNDPRVYEVHRRWTEVHQMYLEDGAREQPKPAPHAQHASIEAEAEAAANAGDLDRAIGLYETARANAPQNELVSERLQELYQARQRANELTGRAPAADLPLASAAADTALASAPSASAAAAAPAAKAPLAEDDWSDVAVDDPAPQRAAPAATNRAATAAPTMKPEDAPVGMQSLDVPFSVGEVISADTADELPVEGASSLPPIAAGGELAFLNELLARVQKNRRKVA